MTKIYGAIAKTEAQDDGTIKVWGYASSEVVDSDGETITADAMKAARDGYMAFGNVREQHDPKKAVGVAIDYEVQEDGRTWFGAHVVDPVAVLKVNTGVLKGFSIGGRVPPGGRDGKVIKSIDLREISLVDRPANPEAVFTMFKADAGPEDEAGPDTEGQGLVENADTVQKGLYDVGRFAQMLQELGYVVADAEWEAQYEGDASPLPAALRDWLGQGLSILNSMAAEESAELLARLHAAVPAPAVTEVAMADAGGDLAKAGKRFSTATKAALKAAHDACKAADKALADLAYDADEDEGTEASDKSVWADFVKAAGGADALNEAIRALGARPGDEYAHVIKKAAAERAELDVFVKAAGASSGLELLKAMAIEIERLKAEPAAPKGYANGQGVAISKAADRDDEPEKETAPVVKADGTPDEVATLIKAAQAKPVRIV
jgi:phage head maturation protease